MKLHKFSSLRKLPPSVLHHFSDFFPCHKILPQQHLSHTTFLPLKVLTLIKVFSDTLNSEIQETRPKFWQQSIDITTKHSPLQGKLPPVTKPSSLTFPHHASVSFVTDLKQQATYQHAQEVVNCVQGY